MQKRDRILEEIMKYADVVLEVTEETPDTASVTTVKNRVDLARTSAAVKVFCSVCGRELPSDVKHSCKVQ